MKTLLMISIMLSFTTHAEVWERPPYQPDENHLPSAIEAQEEITPPITNPHKHQEINEDVSGPSYTPGEDDSEKNQKEDLQK
jgi:hypothetical protein